MYRINSVCTYVLYRHTSLLHPSIHILYNTHQSMHIYCINTPVYTYILYDTHSSIHIYCINIQVYTYILYDTHQSIHMYEHATPYICINTPVYYTYVSHDTHQSTVHIHTYCMIHTRQVV